ncbi:MAG TPA: LD-carboxypeptidase [Sphingobacteriaceae bacterium]|nr:LD-carboxypeptidase [Sphingobacteriaceae bacterium]
MNTPPYLKKGDTVAITCPAKYLPGDINQAVKLLESWGLTVLLGETVTARCNQYAGNDELRLKDFQGFLNDKNVKAIFAARGGYGTIRIIDKLNFSEYTAHPKWIIGFSDITVLHSHIHANYGIQTIHGQMPLTIPDSTKPALETLRKALFGEQFNYEYSCELPNKPGTTEGILIGGNLTLIMMMSGSISEMDFTDKILFIEDVGEYYYSIDRMMWNLKRSGQLAKLKGLIVGAFTELKDYDTPFGKSAEEIILEHVTEYNYPVCFNFPAGHIDDNKVLIFGKEATLVVDAFQVSIGYTEKTHKF